MFFLVWWSQREDLRGRDDKSVLGSSCIAPPIAAVAGHILVCCHCSSLIFGLRNMLTEAPSVSRICTHSMRKWNCDMSPSHSMTCLSMTVPFIEFNLEPPKLSKTIAEVRPFLPPCHHPLAPRLQWWALPHWEHLHNPSRWPETARENVARIQEGCRRYLKI
jgi:hypothetical protein